jgi:predicted TIM-barrel fold metal-dependent hydrolase
MTVSTKSFPVFDCDGHVFEPQELWTEYVEPEFRDAVRGGLWRQDVEGGWDGYLNGNLHLQRRGNGSFFGAIRTPGMDQAQLSRIRMAADPMDIARGAYDPRQRLADMDAMGIDQAMLLPTFCGMWFTAITDPRAALGLARAYNNWIVDLCSTDPSRLFPAMILPQHDNDDAVAEIHRGAELGFRCAIVRPNIIAGRHPAHPSFDPIWQAIADAGLVAGLHPFPAANGRTEAPTAAGFTRKGLIAETLCFGHDAQLALLLLAHHDFWAKFPSLKLAVLESNAAWLPFVLDKIGARVEVWTATRGSTVTISARSGFARSGFISFESDEDQVFELWRHFADIGVWASDYPHFDAEDAWEAIEHMQRLSVPDEVISAMMGQNAARMYGIQSRLVVTERGPEGSPAAPLLSSEQEGPR